MISRSPWMLFKLRVWLARVIRRVYTEVLEAHTIFNHGVLKISFFQVVGDGQASYVVWRSLRGNARVYGERLTFGEASQLVARLSNRSEQRQCLCHLSHHVCHH